MPALRASEQQKVSSHREQDATPAPPGGDVCRLFPSAVGRILQVGEPKAAVVVGGLARGGRDELVVVAQKADVKGCLLAWTIKRHW